MIANETIWTFVILLTSLLFIWASFELYRKNQSILLPIFIVSTVITLYTGSLYQIKYFLFGRPFFISEDALLLLASLVSFSLILVVLLEKIYGRFENHFKKLLSYLRPSISLKIDPLWIFDGIVLVSLLFYASNSLPFLKSLWKGGMAYDNFLDLRLQYFYNHPNFRFYSLGLIVFPCASFILHMNRLFRNLSVRSFLVHIPIVMLLCALPLTYGSKGTLFFYLICWGTSLLTTRPTRRQKWVILASFVLFLSVSLVLFRHFALDRKLQLVLFRLVGVYSETYFAAFEIWSQHLASQIRNLPLEDVFHRYMYFYEGKATLPSIAHVLITDGLWATYGFVFVTTGIIFVFEKGLLILGKQMIEFRQSLIGLAGLHIFLLSAQAPSGAFYAKTYWVLYAFIFIVFSFCKKPDGTQHES